MSSLLLLEFSAISIICAAPLCSSLEFGFSPPEIELDSTRTQRDICAEIEVYSDKPIKLNIEDWWAERKSKDPADFTIMRDALEYSRGLEMDGKDALKVCLKERYSQESFGLILMNVQGSSFSAGVRVNVIGKRNESALSAESRDAESTQDDISILMGSDALQYKRTSGDDAMIPMLAATEAVLVALFVLSIGLARHKARKERLASGRL